MNSALLAVLLSLAVWSTNAMEIGHGESDMENRNDMENPMEFEKLMETENQNDMENSMEFKNLMDMKNITDWENPIDIEDPTDTNNRTAMEFLNEYKGQSRINACRRSVRLTRRGARVSFYGRSSGSYCYTTVTTPAAQRWGCYYRISRGSSRPYFFGIYSRYVRTYRFCRSGYCRGWISFTVRYPAAYAYMYHGVANNGYYYCRVIAL